MAVSGHLFLFADAIHDEETLMPFEVRVDIIVRLPFKPLRLEASHGRG